VGEEVWFISATVKQWLQKLILDIVCVLLRTQVSVSAISVEYFKAEILNISKPSLQNLRSNERRLGRSFGLPTPTMLD
jgi:hypothetical protein